MSVDTIVREECYLPSFCAVCFLLLRLFGKYIESAFADDGDDGESILVQGERVRRWEAQKNVLWCLHQVLAIGVCILGSVTVMDIFLHHFSFSTMKFEPNEQHATFYLVERQIVLAFCASCAALSAYAPVLANLAYFKDLNKWNVCAWCFLIVVLSKALGHSSALSDAVAYAYVVSYCRAFRILYEHKACSQLNRILNIPTNVLIAESGASLVASLLLVYFGRSVGIFFVVLLATIVSQDTSLYLHILQQNAAVRIDSDAKKVCIFSLYLPTSSRPVLDDFDAERHVVGIKLFGSSFEYVRTIVEKHLLYDAKKRRKLAGALQDFYSSQSIDIALENVTIVTVFPLIEHETTEERPVKGSVVCFSARSIPSSFATTRLQFISHRIVLIEPRIADLCAADATLLDAIHDYVVCPNDIHNAGQITLGTVKFGASQTCKVVSRAVLLKF